MRYKDRPFELAVFSTLGHSWKEDESGRVAMPHGTVYAIRLINDHHSRRAIVALSVDGKKIADVVVPPMGYGDLAGPLGSGGLFTFVARGTEEAEAGGQDGVAVDVTGLIQADFSLEAPATNRHERFESSYGGRAMFDRANITKGSLSAPSFEDQGSDGMTVLTGVNHQNLPSTRFREDPNATHVVLTLRLVRAESARPKLDVRPMEAGKVGNPVPPRGWDVAG